MYDYKIKKINNNYKIVFHHLAGVMTANHSRKTGAETSARVLIKAPIR